MWDSIETAISEHTGKSFQNSHSNTVGGGCINNAMILDDGDQRWFVKTNRPNLLAMFEAEHAALRQMFDTKTIRVPEPLCCGATQQQAFLVMECIEFSHHGDAQQLGWRLAEFHKHSSNQFGWDINNTIGSTTQQNQWCDDWIEFYQTRRLRFQVELAVGNGFNGSWVEDAESLIQSVPTFFETYTPDASILHGDLWSGNYGYADNGDPVIFDPALYFGDREADLAMTELFGGFESRFYSAYNEAWPLDEGYAQRKILYNLYHILNHANLFGGGYIEQAKSMIGKLLATVR